MLAEQVSSCEAEMLAAGADPDPLRALCGTIRGFGERQIAERGLNEALFGPHPAGSAFAEQRRAHADALARLVERARVAGVVRAEVTVEDVRVGLVAIASVHALPPAAIRRLVDLVLAGLRPSGDQCPDPVRHQ